MANLEADANPRSAACGGIGRRRGLAGTMPPLCVAGQQLQDRFVPGQRWLSEAEPELGLGTVEGTDGRHVRIRFAASDQERNYAARNAPLSRVRLQVDDRVRDRQGESLQVTEVEERDGLLFYHCVNADQAETLLPEQLLDDRLRLNRPQDRLLTQRIDADTWFTLRYQSWLQFARLWRSPVFGLQGPRIDLIPHQMYIAAEIASRSAPRVLLADEVGLGKTIEAGLILHRLILTERVQRVLIVLPDALINQWLVEMLRRFNLRFAVFDRERFDAADDDNPFHGEQRVLCSLSFLSGQSDVARAALDGDWDLLIVDEAHHLEWSEDESSLAYQLVEALAGRVGSIMLLTATPEQLGRAGHFGRLRLLDPQRFHDYQAFIAEELAYAPVADLARCLLEQRGLNAEQTQRLTDLLGTDSALSAEQAIERLIDRHGTGRVLFRNTRHVIKGFPERRLHTAPLALPEAYSPHAASLYPELAVGGAWPGLDPRVGWLVDLLDQTAPHKVLVICAHAQTAIALRDFLLDRHALHAAMFHERMEIVARDRAAVFFADPEEGTQVLICSEIGSEGRNFQFAHHLVLFDLPLEPDLLEQRIGRLDRIGQRHPIELHVPYMQGSAGEALMRWYRDGLGSFSASCPAASAVFDALGARLHAALADPGAVAALVDEAATMTARINAELEAGRDRLLELNSFRPDRAQALLERLEDSTEAVPLKDYMLAYWDAFGIEHEPGPGRSTVIRTGPHMLSDHYPELSGGAATVTFARDDALAHEDRQFLTWEHPMVLGSIELLTSGELGSAAVTVCSHPDYRTGTVFLETLFLTECAAPPGLELQRYLPPTCLRLLLDAQGRDRAGELEHDQLAGLCLSQNRKLAETVIKSQAERVRLLLVRADELANAAGEALAAAALQQMHAELGAEQERMAALARVNPTVREDEIERLAARRERLASHLQDVRVRLDALRIVVMK